MKVIRPSIIRVGFLTPNPYTPSLNLNNFRQLACTVYFRPFVVQKSCQDVESRFLVSLTGFLPLVNTLKFLQAMNK